MSIQLNKEQKLAVEHSGTPLLVAAGPGSGKTEVITERIKFFIKNGLKPSEILCLTFSEKAANELKTRLEDDEEIKGKIDISEMQVSTYHSFCMNLLRDNTTATGLGMLGGVLDRAVFLVWGIQNIDKFGFDNHIEIGNNATELIEKMIDGISVFNDALITPEALEEYVKEKLSDVSKIGSIEEIEYLHLLDNLVKIYKEYVKFKRQVDVMDYDDLIVEANKLLENENHTHVLTLAQQKYKHILIDEFQDNNFAQFSVVKKLVKDGNITVVGDSDQNIYRFQGAYTEIFQDFRETFPIHTEILLSKNYRNPKSVINFSGELLEHDTFRKPKKITPVKAADYKVNVVQCSTEYAQAEFIKNKIKELLKANPSFTFSDFAILSRKQKDGLSVAQILASEGIPVKYTGSSEMQSSPSAKVLFSFLRIIADPTRSKVSITRILQEYGITEQNISKFNYEATTRARRKNNGDYAFDVLLDLEVSEITQKTQLREISKMIQDFINLAKNSLPSKTIYNIIRNKTDIYRRIANDDSIENFIERSILNDILNSAYNFEKINPNATMKEFLEFIELLEGFDIETKKETVDSNAVQVSTIHKSKGLEFEVVFVIDVATNKIPLKYTEKPFFVPYEIAKGVMPSAEPKEEFLREERRVLYVAMTRTKSHLFLTYPTQYGSRKRANKSSKFLQELKPEMNPNVNFISYDSDSDPNTSTIFDAIEIIKNERLGQAIRHLGSHQYQSAVEKIIDLAKIDYFQKNKSMHGFSPENLFDHTPNTEIDERLVGTRPPRMGFDKPNLSFTHFEKYQKCPKQFWYTYILNALPESQEAPALYKGGVFHKIVEDASKRQKDGVVDDLQVFLSELESKWEPTHYMSSSLQKEDQDKASLYHAFDSYQKWTSKNPNKIKELELKFTTYIEGFPIHGKIDRIEETPDREYVVIDYKTGGKNKKVEDPAKSLQLNLYAMVIKEKYGKLPIRASFFYVEKSEGEQMYEYDVDPAKVDEIRLILEGYVKSIQNKEFEPTPGMFTCKFCSYSDICTESQKKD